MRDVEKIELKISRFLSRGVILSGIMILSGWLVSFNPNKDPFASLQVYRTYSLFNSVQLFVMLDEWGNLLSVMGLGLLITLPVIRVFISMILFYKHKEKKMALIAALVFLGLLLSFTQGIWV